MTTKKGLSVLLVVFFSVLTLACCSFFTPLRLDKPFLLHNSTEKIISWNKVENAEKYNVFVNGQLKDVIEQPQESSLVSYPYSTTFTKDGLYLVKVQAIGDGEHYTKSEFSNEIRVIVGEQGAVSEAVGDLYVQYGVENSILAPQNVSVNLGEVSWANSDSSIGYVIGIYNNENGLKYYVINTNYYDLKINDNHTSFIRVGTMVDGTDDIYFTSGFYYNPYSRNEFTNDFYIFDGGVYDYYVEDYQELQNLHYYAFINRLSSYTFLVASSFQNEFETNYATSSVVLGSFKETYSVTTPIITTVPASDIRLNGLSEKAYTVTCGYSYTQPTIEPNGTSISTPVKTQYEVALPYYEVVDKADRSSVYNDFASDKQFLVTSVNTSEQLLWAVQEGVTPDFNGSTTSRAYKIYDNAKKVLNSIIKEGMTEYEKVLSIYDWILNNTLYDHNALSDMNNSMNYACYYLEGVFLDKEGLAVCDGFSKAFSLLCNMEGIDAVRITGDANSGAGWGGHAWNKVKVNGKWYMVDPTWAEPVSYNSSTGSYYPEVPTHQYFLVDYSDIEGNSHIQFAGNEKYNNYPDDGYCTYYQNTTFTFNNKTYDYFIGSDEEMAVALDYAYANKLYALEVLFSKEYCSVNYNYFTGSYNFSNVLSEITSNLKGYGSILTPSMMPDVRYSLTGEGAVVYIHLQYILASNTGMQDFCDMLEQFDITELDEVYISVDEKFIANLQQYNGDATQVEVNIENAINNYYFKNKNLVIDIILLQSNIPKNYSISGNTVTLYFNTYSVKITEVVASV